MEIVKELEGNIIIKQSENKKLMVLGSEDFKIRYYNNSSFYLISVVDI